MKKQDLHPRTAVINKTQKNQAKQQRLAALKWLSSQFPAAFDNNKQIRPLKTGIIHDILQHAELAAKEGISKSKLREAIVLFTRRVDYLTCLKAQEMRVDLQGNPVEKVSVEDAERAAAKIKKRVEKSARNARKLSSMKKPEKPLSHQENRDSYHYTFSQANKDAKDNLPQYPSRASAFENQTSQASTKQPSVIIKNKPNKQYDPEAVKRLKDKLGLANANNKHETTP